MLNEVDVDFRIPGLPYSVVKHAQSTSVRQLIQKIENHPDRHGLQQDLRQNQACKPFSPDARSTLTDGWFEDNTSKDPFSRCATCKNYGYSLS